jgi:hypothetical protein
MKKEKPVKVIKEKKYRGSHRMETRVFARNIHEHYCVEKGCKFYGKPAVQGHCHTTTTFVDGADWGYIDRAEKFAEQELKEAKKSYKGKALLRYLESAYVCRWLGQVNSLDSLIRLRRENALLRDRVEKFLSRTEKSLSKIEEAAKRNRSKVTSNLAIFDLAEALAMTEAEKFFSNSKTSNSNSNWEFYHKGEGAKAVAAAIRRHRAEYEKE